jgi:DNA-binding response OmpR family regulator
MAHRAVPVDDDISTLIETVLTCAGMETTVAATGEEGLRLVRDLRPDLVTLDVGLPDVDGTEVCRRLRGRLVVATDSSPRLCGACSAYVYLGEVGRP